MVKQWVGAQVEGSVAAEVERVAKSRGISRSDLIREALERRLRDALDEDEERLTRQESNHRQIMRRFDYLVGMIREQERKLGLPDQDSPLGDSPTNNTADEADGRSARYAQLANPEEGGVHGQPDDQPRESSLARARKRTGRRMQ
jgi:hypothetical protein